MHEAWNSWQSKQRYMVITRYVWKNCNKSAREFKKEKSVNKSVTGGMENAMSRRVKGSDNNTIIIQTVFLLFSKALALSTAIPMLVIGFMLCLHLPSACSQLND